VGLVGCGEWGRHILRDLVTLGADVVVVARSHESRKRAADGGARTIVGSLSELPAVDGIVVAVPTAIHADVVGALLDRGVPIFCEKPLTADPASAQRLAAQAPDRIFVMDKWRYHPGVEALRDLARSQELGPVLGLRTTRANWGNRHVDVDGVWILAPHDLAIILEILGAIPAPRFAVGEHIDGVPATLMGVLGEAPWAVIEVSTRHHQWRREQRLHCAGGVAVISDAYASHVEIAHGADAFSTSARVERRALSDELPLLRELRVFLQHLAGGPPPRTNAADSARIVSVLGELRRLAGQR
jgi:predicted dehydrogenase